MDESDIESISDISDNSDQISACSAHSFQENYILHAFLEKFGLTVAREAVRQIRDILSGQIKSTTHAQPGSRQSQDPNTAPEVSQPVGLSTGSTGKRKLGDLEEDPNDPGGKGSDDDPNKRRRMVSVSANLPPRMRKFACPYYRRNSDRHRKWRSCFGPGWDSIHRVK